MPTEQRWREGFFFYNWLFPSGPRLTGWEEETGGQRSACSLSPTHTHSHTHTHTHTDHKDGPNGRGLQEHIRRVWDWGDVGTSIKPSPSNYCRHSSFTGQAHYTKTKHTHTQSLTKYHTLPSYYKKVWKHTHNALLQHMWTSEQVGPRPWSPLWVAVFYIRQAWPSCTMENVCVCVCVCVCPLCKPPWKAPLLKSHVGLQTLQSCCLRVYSAISGSTGYFSV